MDNSFLDQDTDLALVTRTHAITAFIIFGLILTLTALVITIFSLGRQGYGIIIWRVSNLLFASGLFSLLCLRFTRLERGYVPRKPPVRPTAVPFLKRDLVDVATRLSWIHLLCTLCLS